MKYLVQYLDHEKGCLVEESNVKIYTLVHNDLFRQAPVQEEHHYECLPIPGYNTRTYKLKRRDDHRGYVCNCQGYHKRGNCAHEKALRIWLLEKQQPARLL